MPFINKNLKDELIKVSVDKFLIGILLILMGSFATNVVEKITSFEGRSKIFQNSFQAKRQPPERTHRFG